MGELKVIVLSIKYILNAVTTITLIYGVTSWVVVKKFRNYMNYIFLNLLLAHFLYILFDSIFVYLLNEGVLTKENENILNEYCIWVLGYVLSVRNHWSITICHMFYVEFVKLYNRHIQRRYLKSSLFGWGVPLVTTPISMFVSTYIYADAHFVISVFPFILNSLLYIIIVFSLCRSFKESAPSATNKCSRLYIATLIFLLGDVSYVSVYIVTTVKPEMHYLLQYFIPFFFHFFNPLVVSLFLVVVKINRELWHEFFVNKYRQRLSARMQERVVPEPGNL